MTWQTYDGLEPKERKPTKPTPFITFDIETIAWKEPYALGVHDGQSTIVFKGRDCVSSFLELFLRKKYRGMIAYAHNGGRFDFLFFLETLRKDSRFSGYEIDFLKMGGSIVSINVRKDKHKWILRDSYKLLPFKLADIGAKFSLDVRKGELDHSKINWDNWESLESEWRPYLENDCIVLYQALRRQEEWSREKYGVTLKRNITLPSVAKDTFQKNYLKGAIPSHKWCEDDIRRAYFGGRVEIFKPRITNANYYDVNSLYPHVMRNRPMPVGRPVKGKMTLNDFGIVKARVTSPTDIKIPVLPYRKDGKGKLFFPRGSWTGFFTTPELRLAKEKGYTIDIEYGYRFEQAYIFTEYIDELYALKEQSHPDSIDYTMAKLLMNSLYGKFGQGRVKKKYYINPDTVIGLTPEYEDVSDLELYSKEVTNESGAILPALAVFVTSYARIELYKYLDGNDPAYCDTDSIMTRSILPTGRGLGELKREMEVVEGYYRLPKLYALKLPHPTPFHWLEDAPMPTVVKHKGFPKGTLTYAQVEYAVKTGDDAALTYERSGFSTMMESLRRDGSMVSVATYRRSVKSLYDKRCVTGIDSTDPLTIVDVETTEQ